MTLAELSISEAGEGLRRRRFSSVELTAAVLERIEARNGVLHAFVHIDADGARAAAKRADGAFAAGEDSGPLQGIPVAIKDLIDTADMPTAYGSRLWVGHRPEADAACVTSIRQGGAVLVGKVATYEFATVGPSFDTPFPPAVNPWNLEHITGGSSSGSASAIAGGLVRLAVGTDTGGSVRSPASYCGIVGFKPTRGAISNSGVFPLSPSLDHVGPLAASVRDAAAGYAVMAGIDLGTITAGAPRQDLSGVIVGYARDWFANDPLCDPAVIDALDNAASTLSLLGAQIREIAMPDYDDAETAAAAILHAESVAIHRPALAERADEFGIKTRRTLLAGAALKPDDIARATAFGERLAREIDAVLDEVEVILTASTLAPAPAVDLFRGSAAVWTPMRTIAFNLTGHPALALPAGHANSLPLGLQLIGRRGEDGALLAIGEAFEVATDHLGQAHWPLRGL